MGLFSKMTTDEMDVLRDYLRSGQTKQHKVTNDHDGFWETSAVMDDISADRRVRWNSENPEHTY